MLASHHKSQLLRTATTRGRGRFAFSLQILLRLDSTGRTTTILLALFARAAVSLLIARVSGRGEGRVGRVAGGAASARTSSAAHHRSRTAGTAAAHGRVGRGGSGRGVGGRVLALQRDQCREKVRALLGGHARVDQLNERVKGGRGKLGVQTATNGKRISLLMITFIHLLPTHTSESVASVRPVGCTECCPAPDWSRCPRWRRQSASPATRRQSCWRIPTGVAKK